MKRQLILAAVAGVACATNLVFAASPKASGFDACDKTKECEFHRDCNPDPEQFALRANSVDDDEESCGCLPLIFQHPKCGIYTEQ